MLLRLPRKATIRVGRLGVVSLRRGYYAYVGSAFGPGGLAARVTRHVRQGARTHWHIDYVRRIAQPVGVWFSTENARREHEWAEALQRAPWTSEAAPQFGASDCRCESHLFFLGARPSGEWWPCGLGNPSVLEYQSLTLRGSEPPRSAARGRLRGAS